MIGIALADIENVVIRPLHPNDYALRRLCSVLENL
jgi:hypothetical protein